MIASIPGLTNVFTLQIQHNVYGFTFLPFSSGKRITNIKNNLKNTTIQFHFLLRMKNREYAWMLNKDFTLLDHVGLPIVFAGIGEEAGILIQTYTDIAT